MNKFENLEEMDLFLENIILIWRNKKPKHTNNKQLDWISNKTLPTESPGVDSFICKFQPKFKKLISILVKLFQNIESEGLLVNIDLEWKCGKGVTKLMAPESSRSSYSYIW
jgi:hypothetical protein